MTFENTLLRARPQREEKHMQKSDRSRGPDEKGFRRRGKLCHINARAVDERKKQGETKSWPFSTRASRRLYVKETGRRVSKATHIYYTMSKSRLFNHQFSSSIRDHFPLSKMSKERIDFQRFPRFLTFVCNRALDESSIKIKTIQNHSRKIKSFLIRPLSERESPFRIRARNISFRIVKTI